MKLPDSDFIKGLIRQISPEHQSAIALDFDGVCKLFTEHKHQIMSTLLFLHFPEFQKMTLEQYKKAYVYINFFSKDYAGKARFLCINALANFLSEEQGFSCKLSGLDTAIKDITARGVKVNAASLTPFAADKDVERALAWSTEVDRRVAQLTGIGLTSGIKEHILDKYRDKADFYLVSTATESSIRNSMERENIFFIKRYFGQETAGKAEALTALVNAGYKNVFMFGDSVEDSRAANLAKKETPPEANLFFVPVIPGDENKCFARGEIIIRDAEAGNNDDAKNASEQMEKEFQGKEVGSNFKIK